MAMTIASFFRLTVPGPPEGISAHPREREGAATTMMVLEPVMFMARRPFMKNLFRSFVS